MVDIEDCRHESQTLRQRADSADVEDLADYVLALCDDIEVLRDQVKALRETCTVAYQQAASALRDLAVYDVTIVSLPTGMQALFGAELKRAQGSFALKPVEKPSGEIER